MSEFARAGGAERKTSAGRAVPCPRCGYDLRGLRARRCPECGIVAAPWEFRANPGTGEIIAATVALIIGLGPNLLMFIALASDGGPKGFTLFAGGATAIQVAALIMLLFRGVRTWVGQRDPVPRLALVTGAWALMAPVGVAVLMNL